MIEESTTANRRNSKRETPYKKCIKPLLEKRRRARINNSLSQLKLLVLQAMRRDTSDYTKLEKADVLDMTVKYLRYLQQQHIPASRQNSETMVTNKYKAGFSHCATEVLQYMESMPNINDDVKTRVLDNLANRLQCPPSEPTPMQSTYTSLTVNIPSYSPSTPVASSSDLLLVKATMNSHVDNKGSLFCAKQVSLTTPSLNGHNINHYFTRNNIESPTAHVSTNCKSNDDIGMSVHQRSLPTGIEIKESMWRPW